MKNHFCRKKMANSKELTSNDMKTMIDMQTETLWVLQNLHNSMEGLQTSMDGLQVGLQAATPINDGACDQVGPQHQCQDQYMPRNQLNQQPLNLEILLHRPIPREDDESNDDEVETLGNMVMMNNHDGDHHEQHLGCIGG